MGLGSQGIEIGVINLVFPALGLVITAIRLALRIRSSRFWWDDALAVVSCIFTSFISAIRWIYFDPTYGKSTRIVAYYTMVEAFYIGLWAARLAILYSILRIVPLPETRTLLNRASIAFVCACAILCAQVFWVCETQPGWKNKPTPQCTLGLQVVICQLLTDIASDFLLIIVPIRLFGSINLERGLKIRLLVIFGVVALITIASLVHIAYLLQGLGRQAIISGSVEVSVSLIVCNLTVVVPAFWRACGVRDEPIGAQERVFKLSLSAVRFASSPYRAHPSVADTTTVLSAQDPQVLDVTGIIHDQASSPTAEPPGRKSIRLERGEEHGTAASAKGSPTVTE